MKSKHTHKYFRSKLMNQEIWACALDCNHYMPNHMIHLMAGKSSICWECNDEFTLDALNMRKDKPVCASCDSSAITLSDVIERTISAK